MLNALVKIAKSDLVSRTVRNQITNNSGTRNIKGRDRDSFLPSVISNLFGSLFNSLLEFKGWFFNVIGGLNFNFSGAWSYLTQSALQLYYFNWNITDQNIDQILAQQKAILSGQLGETVGNLLGYLVCGVAPSAAIMAFNEPLGAYLLKEAGEEALDEFLSNFQVLLQMSFQMGVQRFAFENYKNIRRNVRNLVKDPNSLVSRTIKNIFGDNALKAIQNWGTEGSKPWSFASAVEEWIESFKDPVIENFLEELIESFIEACIEAGYVVAGGIDSWVVQQKMTQPDNLLGRETIVEITPNREAEAEKIVLAAPRELLKQELVSTMRTHSLIDNRDVGMWVGEPVREYVRTLPISIQLRIFLFDVPTPPWQRKRPKKIAVKITVPNVSRTKVDWQTIKNAVGGTNGYLWGRFLARVRLDTGHILKIYGGTEQEAIDRVKAILVLSNSELLGLTVSEEKKEGSRKIYSALQKETTRVYPAYFTIVNQKKVLNEDSGRATLTGVYQARKYQIPLWLQEKPENFDQIIQELFTTPGSN
jgi:hypothetical protein